VCADRIEWIIQFRYPHPHTHATRHKFTPDENDDDDDDMGCVASSRAHTTDEENDPSPYAYGVSGTTTRRGSRNYIEDWTLPKTPYRVTAVADAAPTPT
jgi:hypothetical protein